MLNLLVLMVKEFYASQPTALVIEINPHHAALWHGLGWKQIGPQRHCARVNAPSVLLWAHCQEIVDYAIRAFNRDIDKLPWKLCAPYFMPWNQADGMVSRLRRDIGKFFLGNESV
jgi:hypothetical protein